MKTYSANRTESGRAVRVLRVLPNGHSRTGVLSPATSQKVFNHSPDGFEWGYGGSGPAQLALALLIDALYPEDRNHETAVRLHQDFKEDVISKLDREKWEISEVEIDAWVTAQLERRT